MADDYKTSVSIPLWENSWGWDKTEKSFITDHRNSLVSNGEVSLKEPGKAVKAYIHVKDTGNLHIGFHFKQVEKAPQLKLSLAGKSQILSLDGLLSKKELKGGTFHVQIPGYQELTLETDGKGGVKIDSMFVAGSAVEKGASYVKDNFHFGRRGPSVHLRYSIPEESQKPLYFYSELEVPEGEDVIGSYFMADGFSHGYFGMQVNSEKERRILFSVWSPYKTDNPEEIPEDQKIRLLQKGEHVHTGEFGNEGSGGQSYKKLMWKSGKTYKFLLKGEPSGKNTTDYTAYFYAPEDGEWQLIASFRRPEAGNYLGDLYSFLENFIPATGAIARKANYKNQWVYDADKGWLPITKAVFTADATARKGDRLDYQGGETAAGYYLQNCGFFNETTPMNTEFEHRVDTTPPDIDFKILPNQ